MRIGTLVNPERPGLDDLLDGVQAAARAGLDSAFLPQLASWDALTVAALAGARVPGIDVGTSIVPTYPRHAIALAGQALTAHAATGGRFTLGVGPGHKPVIEGVFGHSYDRPADHIREYLTVLGPLLRGERVEHRGRTVTAVGALDTPGAGTPDLLLAALGPRMLRVAGELADGVVVVWTGPDAIAEHIRPTVTEAAAAAGRPAPRIVVTAIVSVTADPARVLREVGQRLGFAGELPAYRAQLDRQGKKGVVETVIAGDEETVARGIRRYAEAGATELTASLTGTAEERAATLALLAALRPEV
ncbi:TIGR03564 family F420-dependent LLM class oxidoreductase [Embleya sp. MST-111070]|uniref:TIGR03564 family F420-dependent LLM class oxidoreductase n=1 Tax=Embleya sp. MST-111070 TaxID=3398231 RepID=UPI003F741F99